jgi:hypothetical protein
MSLFHSRSSGKLKPAWTYTTEGVIWRLVPAGGLRFVGEERDLQKKDVAFFCLEGETGRPLWEGRTFGERWWTGIEAVHEGVMLLHAFATPELPEHRGITAVDIHSAAVLWEASDLTFLSLQEGAVRALRLSRFGRQQVDLDTRLGTVVREIGPDEGRPSTHTSPVVAGLQMPVTIDRTGSETGLDALLRIAGAAKVEGPVERLDIGKFAILGFHHRGLGAGEMQQTVAVIDRGSGTVLFSEQTASGLLAVVPDSFIVYDSTLFILREQRTLVAVRLPGEEA